MHTWKPLNQLVKDVRSGEVSAESLVQRALQAIEELDPTYKAIISVAPDALAQAQAIDQRIKNGDEIGPLAGVPYIAKDNFLTTDHETTAASKILGGFIPPYSATAVKKLEAAGAILIAKANMDSFGHGSSTENSDFGTTSNPHDPERVPGGSSGGSAAAVVLGLAPFSIGTDTGGSIRQPASYSGAVGFKPTYGLVSRFGVIAMASSTDVIGPITTGVADAAQVLEVLSGQDQLDATTIERDEVPYTELSNGLKGKKFGLIKQYMDDGVEAGVREQIQAAADKITQAGGEVVEVDLPTLKLALAAYYIIMPAEVSSNLSRYDGVRFGYTHGEADSLETVYDLSRQYGFNREAKRRILIGTYVLSSGYYDAYYRRAQSIRTLVKNDFERALNEVDFLIGPVAPNTAFKKGENDSDPLQMYLVDIMTVSASLAGIPAVSVPVGKAAGLPVGLQIMANQRADRALLGAAAGVEAAVGYES